MTNKLPIGIVIDDPGLCAIIVDKGRLYGQERGFSEAGPMDEEAYFWANWLCGNEESEPTLECIGSLAFTVNASMAIAVTGPAVKVVINGEECSSWKTHAVVPADKVVISADCPTAKMYVALGGKWLLKHVMGSVCTVMREGIGGLHGNGKPLVTGDTIPIRVGSIESKEVPAWLIPAYDSMKPIDVIPGYQVEEFLPLARRRFFSADYKVTSDINRMGYRLQGPAVSSKISNMRSEGINFGAIQFPSDGQPIIMLRDRQTLGGYPKIGCVAPYDIPRLVQTPVDGVVCFQERAADDARTNWLLARSKRVRYLTESL
ncbi:biotin-dependent carboxyltransferase family protein [Alteromonas ponticola]|uniref:Biotin-dependent carboxyltransferase family protein n=1 Tax=Alteromonas aquimaris TaxID=2998417 RepID=A0ABT3P7D5_9ALTE|nr:biotin-dependent carboxyltransferase family protein [Alteromonas aquimaris]MCW8108677.1 biotin-dependent carboxyltransferase family protein [Alteromonas aquimaris]